MVKGMAIKNRQHQPHSFKNFASTGWKGWPSLLDSHQVKSSFPKNSPAKPKAP